MCKIKLFITTLLLFAFFNSIAQNSGDIDPTFNPNDVGFNNGVGANSRIKTVEIQSDGKIITGGMFTSYNGISGKRVARLNIDGTVDMSYNLGTGADGDVKATAQQSDGKVLIGGYFNNFTNTARKYLIRLNTNGTIDASFNNGTGISGPASSYTGVETISIQPDDKIIIGGYFSTVSSKQRGCVARLNIDGTVDTTFTTAPGANNPIYTTALQSDGKIIVAGKFTSYNGISRNRIARLHSDGSLDTTFNVGTGVNNDIYSTVIQSDGKIIIGGLFTTYDGVSRNSIARLNVDGSLDTTFNIGTGANNIIYTTALQSDGKIIIGGSFNSYNGTTINRIARINLDGSLDNTFNVGAGTNNTVDAIDIKSNSQIIIAGNFTTCNGKTRKYMALLNSDGTLDDSFNALTGANNTIYTTLIQPDNKIIIGGDFYTYNGTSINRIARIYPNGILDTSFNAAGNVGGSDVYTSVLQPDGKIIVSGDFTYYNGIPKNRIVRLNSDGSLDTTFNIGTGAEDVIRTTVIQPDGKIIIGGNFTNYNGIPKNRIARLNSDGSLDTTFNIGTGSDSSIYTVAIQSDGKIIIGGYFTSYNGIAKNYIARLNIDGSLDDLFNPIVSTNNVTFLTIVQPDGKIIIVGGFDDGGWFGVDGNISRLNTDGTLDTTFNIGTGADGAVWTTVLQPDGKIIVGGNFTNYNGIPKNRIARLNPDGSLDESFVVGTGVERGVESISLLSNGQIVIGGSFESYNGIGRNRIAKLNNCINTFSVDTIITCDSITWLDGNTYTTSTNTPTFILTNSVGCDSIITLNLTINSTSSIDSIVACDSITWMDGNTYTTSTNAPTFILTNAVGCDSVITLNLTINSNSSTDTVIACDSITWIDGNTYAATTNTPTFTLTNASGCDSVVTLNLTINNSTFGTDVITACDSITWIDGNTYTVNTNTPTYVLTNTAGCDSVVTLNLTINNSSSSTDIITSCDSITWIDGNTYTISTNTPTYALTNAVGCDSIVTLNLTINNPSTSTDIITACDSVTWIDGNTYTSSTTTPTFTILGGSSTGCDSVVTLNLTISPIDISVVSNPYTIVAVESGATYQWLDCNNGNAIISGETNQTYIPASSGNYAVVVSKNGCVDTSACVNFCNIEANYLFTDNGNGNYTFTNATSGNYTQSHWAFGDGNTSTATNPNHTFTVNNTFAVVLTVNDSTTVSPCMSYYIEAITVTGVVSPLQCAAGFTMYTDTNNINIILNATGTNLTYLWDFGDGNTSNAQFPTHTYATTGNYYLCLTIDDGAGCVDMYCDSIGENGVVFNKQTGFTINVIAPPLATQVNEQVAITSAMSIFPNPTGGLLNVVFNHNELYQLKIVAIDGKLIESKTTVGNTTLDVNSYASGMYFITATNKEGKVYQSKFVKE